MKKNVCSIIAVILFCQLLFPAFSASEAQAETRVTFTFAAGGVACGIYFFLQFTLKSSMTAQLNQDAAALLNYGPDGWRIDYPSLSLGGKDLTPSSGPYPDAVHMEILKFLF